MSNKPEGYIETHLLVEHSQGRILSSASGLTKLFGALCDPSKYELPSRVARNKIGFTGDPRACSCLACRQHPDFAKIWETVTDEEYDVTKDPVVNPS